MKALVYHGPRDMRWDDWPEQPPGPGEIVVSVQAVGICGSDLHGYTGESGRRVPPMVMGHEAAGIVSVLGAGVSDHWQGARVILQPFVACGLCDCCRTGQINLCRNRQFFGGSINGAMSERFTVPMTNVLPLPESLDFAAGTLAEPLAVALHAARQAGDLHGKAVLIAGSGPIGLLTLIAAQRAGARAVVMTDVIPRRLEAARALGATAALNPTGDDWRAALGAALRSPTGEVDVAFDAVGIPATFAQAQSVLFPGGLLVAVGGWRTVELNLAPLVTREITIRGTFNFYPDEFEQAVRLLAEEAVDPHCLITGVRPLASGAAVFAALAANQTDSIKVVLSTQSTQEGTL
jgi:L-iditol 2-dehydrogenase